jgi:hypothetical protein
MPQCLIEGLKDDFYLFHKTLFYFILFFEEPLQGALTAITIKIRTVKL